MHEGLLEKYLAHGIDLEPFGLASVLLECEWGLKLIEEARAEGIPVLGGDVYAMVNGVPKITEDNWSCDQLAGEPDEEYAERSANVAKSYLMNYPRLPKPHFSIDLLD